MVEIVALLMVVWWDAYSGNLKVDPLDTFVVGKTDLQLE
jgi:hypothetical protein